ncbi:uncharacterized protein LOC142341704 [Convolutriloba macropyga]|uniref:uncharacterized protein LOC142341704 n=1 Tax=Convolutriloba macropyga TaxID=536237 RepID=UPI003F51EFE3
MEKILNVSDDEVDLSSTGESPSSSDEVELWSGLFGVVNGGVIPLIGLCGFVLNGLGVATLLHMGINSSSMAYMLILSIGDIISGFVDSILTVGVKYWIRDLYTISELSCKILKWLNYSTTFSTQFVLVLFTFDRLLAVTYPLKYRLLKHNLKYPIMTSASAWLLLHILTSGNLYVFDLSVDGRSCGQSDDISQLGGVIYFHYTATLLYCAIPASLLFIFNIVILVQMKKNAKNVNKEGRESAITKILLIVSFAYLIFTALSIIPLYIALFYLEPKLGNNEEWVDHLYSALLQLNELPATANVSFNFVFYILGSRIFRKEFLSMLRQYCCCIRGQETVKNKTCNIDSATAAPTQQK